MSNCNLATKIADLTLDTFNSLPQKCKPRILDCGKREWTPMSSIAIFNPANHCLKLISLATGTKSLPVSVLSRCQGQVLHDCHAEILAVRGLNLWILQEIKRLLHKDMSEWIEKITESYSEWTVEKGIGSKHDDIRPNFRLKKGVEVSMFSTEAPCGDASMDILIDNMKKRGEDVVAWLLKDGKHIADVPPAGRAGFDKLGALRRKPARADAEVSMSMSCTDKIMLKQFRGLLSFPVELLVRKTNEVFLSNLIVYPDQHHVEGYQRAFGRDGRLKGIIANSCLAENSFREFAVDILPNEFRRFEFEKGEKGERKVSNISALWIAQDEDIRVSTEVLVNGVKQGFKQFARHPRKASTVSRAKLMEEAFIVTALMRNEGFGSLLSICAEKEWAYSVYKRKLGTQSRSELKDLVLQGVGGWPKKSGFADDFHLCENP